MTPRDYAMSLLAGADYCGKKNVPCGNRCAACIAVAIEQAMAEARAAGIEAAAMVADGYADESSYAFEIAFSIRALATKEGS